MESKNKNKNLLVVEDVDDTSSLRTTIIKESPKLDDETIPYELNKILLRNVPYYINKEYLELYIDYLTGEIEIERIDQSKIDSHAIMVTFKSNIDFYSIHKKYSLKPKLNDTRIEVSQVAKPTMLFLQFSPLVSKDMLELYFSNRKRSLGGDVVQVILDNTQTCAIIVFKDHLTTKRVVTKQHQINKQNISVKLYYKNFGLDPFDEFLIPYQYYNQDNSNEKLRQLTMTMNMRSEYLTHVKNHSSNNKNNNYKANYNHQMVENNLKNVNNEKAIKSVTNIDPNQNNIKNKHKLGSSIELHQINRQKGIDENLLKLQNLKAKSSKLPPKPLIINQIKNLKDDSKDEQISNKEVAIEEPESKDAKPETTYDYETIQSLFSFDSQSFIEAALGNHDQTVPDQDEEKIIRQLDRQEFPLVISLYNSQLKLPKDNKFENDDTQPSSSSTPLVETPKSKSEIRQRKIVVRVNNLQNLPRPVAPKLVSKNLTKNFVTASTDSINTNILTLKNNNPAIVTNQAISKSFEDIERELKNEENKNYLSPKINNLGKSNQMLDKSSRPAGKNPYGSYSIAKSIDKLGIEQIKFLKISKHLNEIQQLYPKLKINLNEKTRHLYLFGAPKQVNDAEKRFKGLIDNLKVTEFKLDSLELASFLKKEAIQEKLLKFIQIIFDNNDTKASNTFFCNYEILIDKNNDNYKLIIYANSLDIGQMLFKYIIENIRVSFTLNLNSMPLIDLIKSNNDDDQWSVFYKKNYLNRIDYDLKQNNIIQINSNNNNNNSLNSSRNESLKEDNVKTLKIEDFDDLAGNYSLSITGFKEDVDEFCDDFKKKFVQT